MTVATTAEPPWVRSGGFRGRFVRQGKSSKAKSSSPRSSAWEMSSKQPAPSFAVIEARKSLAALVLPRATLRAVEAFLGAVCASQSTVPSVTYGDDSGSALLHWVAGPMTVEVEVGPQGATYLWATDQDGTQSSLEGSRQQIESSVRRLLATMATRVQRSNPGWREQYLKR